MVAECRSSATPGPTNITLAAHHRSEDLDPSDAGPSQIVCDIAAILSAMIDRVVDFDDP
jgi:hypothetical protein